MPKKTATESIEFEKPVRVLMYGGTLDSKSYKHTKEYKERGEPPEYVTARKHSLVPKTLRDKPYGAWCSCTQMGMKDSQKFTDQEVDGMVAQINAAAEPVVVVTFGTDAMEDVVRMVANKIYDSSESPENANARRKVVVFTGAMEPLSHGHSDGEINLEYAIRGGLQLRDKPDVYLAMQNAKDVPKLFRVDHELQKVREIIDRVTGRKKKYFAGNTVDVTLPPLAGVVR